MILRRLRWSELTRGERIRLVAGGLALGLVVIGLAWVIVTGLLARAELDRVKAGLPKLRHALATGNSREASVVATDLSDHAHRAHQLTTGPAWWVSANLPVLGAPLRTGRLIALQTDQVAQNTLPGLIRLSSTLSGASLHDAAGIDLTPFVRSEPTLDVAATSASEAVTAIGQDTSASSWLPLADDARQSVLTGLTRLRDDLLGAQHAVRTLLPMLGQSTPQRYFVGFQNEAESRGLGGLPGAFAILTVDHGQLRFTHFGNDTELAGVRTNLDLGSEFDARYGAAGPTDTYVNSNISPDFRDAGRIWAALWEKKSGQHVNAAIAIDPTALGYLLKVTGPASLPGGSQVTAHNVVALTQKKQYSLFASDRARNAFLNQIAKAVASRLITGRGRTVDVVKAATRAVAERRIAVWSADPRIESMIVEAGYGAVLAPNDAFTGFVVVNGAGSKLDYYLDRTMTYERSDCRAGGTANATLRLTNHAPRKGLPPYVTFRADKHPRGVEPGDNRLLVTYYGSSGSQITSVRVDGALFPVLYGTENGLTTVTVDLELAVREPRTVVVTIREPTPTGPLQVLRQPLVRPLDVVTRTCH